MPGGSANVQGEIHVDRYLTNYSVTYMQNKASFVAGRASSLIRVNNQSDKFVVYDRGYFWRDEMKTRPLGGRPSQVGYKVGEGTYSALEWAAEHTIDDRQRGNVDDPIDLDRSASRLLSDKAMIRADRIWATNFFVPNVWTTLQVGVGSTPGANQFLEFDDANSDPIGVVDDMKDTMHQLTGFMPNVLVLGATVRKTLRSHPDIADRIKYTGVGLADEAKLQELFDIPAVVTARSIYNTAAEGAADDFQYIVDKRSMLMAYIEPTPTVDSPTAIGNFAWQGLVPGQTNDFGGVITRGRDGRAYSDWFHNRMAFDLKIVAADLGVFFQNAVSTSA